MKILRLSQRSYGKTENKNREKRAKSESTEIFTLTHSARCRSNEIFFTVFVGVKRFSFNNDRFGENISFSRCNIKWIYESQRVGEGHLCESIVSLRQIFPFVYTCFPSNMSQFSFLCWFLITVKCLILCFAEGYVDCEVWFMLGMLQNFMWICDTFEKAGNFIFEGFKTIEKIF